MSPDRILLPQSLAVYGAYFISPDHSNAKSLKIQQTRLPANLPAMGRRDTQQRDFYEDLVLG
ncbi:hypothetical protein [Nitratireductor sp. OM-1]|uniref:hypothetical protein n=1 Tax=Nitratireductor sp. OM-1 TaxID=1756988 RepID=UPI000DDF5157|nr:hypothetical protein [Nitratireductor sp. OM-1]